MVWLLSLPLPAKMQSDKVSQALSGYYSLILYYLVVQQSQCANLNANIQNHVTALSILAEIALSRPKIYQCFKKLLLTLNFPINKNAASHWRKVAF